MWHGFFFPSIFFLLFLLSAKVSNSSRSQLLPSVKYETFCVFGELDTRLKYNRAQSSRSSLSNVFYCVCIISFNVYSGAK